MFTNWSNIFLDKKQLKSHKSILMINIMTFNIAILEIIKIIEILKFYRNSLKLIFNC